MFTVRAPVRGYNGISAGVSFAAGVGHTDNPGALAYFARAGYTLELEAVPAAPEPVVEIVPDAYDGLTKKQLVALAAERGIEVNPKSSNAVLRDALIAVALADEFPTEPAPADGQVVPASSETDPFAAGEVR